ncbi:MAG: thiamine-phosphate kinase, partial [Planctomycetota bacterium]
LSDLAAMGSKPVAATVNLFLPKHFSLEQCQLLYLAMEKTASKFDVEIFGGDTNSWDGKLVVGATLFGTVYPNARSEFWRMDTAKPGDRIFVTGPLGGSISGRHLSFEPRNELAKYLIQNYDLSAATDITDSLAIDLASLAAKSNCGFQIHEQQIPVSIAAQELATPNSEYSAVKRALYDGEDFELIIGCNEATAKQLHSDNQVSNSVFEIGQLIQPPEFLICRSNGQTQELEIQGYVH